MRYRSSKFIGRGCPVSVNAGGTTHVVWWNPDALYSGEIYYRRAPPAPMSVSRSSTSIISYSLSQNYPNPFNSSTTIGFTLACSSFVTLEVYDLLGQKVATLVNETKSVGEHKFRWNTNSLPSGIYFYRLHAGTFTQTGKLVLLR